MCCSQEIEIFLYIYVAFELTQGKATSGAEIGITQGKVLAAKPSMLPDEFFDLA